MRIVVAMSGGVDSSVAAALLAEQGHEVIGLSMQLYPSSPRAPRADAAPQMGGRASAEADDERAFGSCCTPDDLHDARRVARVLDIPHYIVNFERQFHERVVSNFVSEYSAGRTPLPCAHCNSDLKFATLLERARGLGADAVATGHYARVERDADGHPVLKRGLDAGKDQSYFLFALTGAQLAHALFPVGGLDKEEVRERARQMGLPVANKPDSQEICFVPDRDYAKFVGANAPADALAGGAIIDAGGHRLGRHDGIHRFTVGQRKGLGLPGSSSPLYVLALRPVEREVVVGPRSALERTGLTASEVNWIAGPPAEPIRVEAQIRYRHRAAAAIVRPTGTARAEVVFEQPQIAVTPGQAVVFYEGETVLGGGWIDSLA